jgi:D-alanine-D-alanine ligase
MDSRLRVAVVYGGPSCEAEVSERSGERVVCGLAAKRHRVLPIWIDRAGCWNVAGAFLDDPPAVGQWTPFQHRPQRAAEEAGTRIESVARSLDRLSCERVDVAFIALHGRGGEDGAIQGLFESVNLPYTGSGVAASALAMDKWRARAVFQEAGVHVPRGLLVEGSEACAAAQDRILSRIGCPCVVKPRCEGSSVAVSIVRAAEELGRALENARALGRDAVVEEYVSGCELTCGVLGNSSAGPLEALPPTEIRPVGSTFFDYRAKYTSGAAHEITPAPIPAADARRLQETAVGLHRAIGCEGFSRTDAILRDGEIYALETNTIPGLTDGSLLPQQARAAGIAFPDLVDRVVRLAMERFGR